METLWTKLQLLLNDRVLRTRVLFAVGALVVFRALATIPIPGVDVFKLEQFLNNNQFIGLLNIFSGGGLSTLSVVMLGVGPYITASIIMQLLTMMFPTLKAMYQEDGEIGRRKFTQYTRLAALPLAALQAFGFLLLLEKQGILGHLTTFDLVRNIGVVTAGSIFLMWIGELISEFGIGNGVSLIIFAGIVAQLPLAVSRLAFAYDPSQIPLYIVATIIGLLVIASVVVVTEAERPIPVTYAKRVQGNRVYGGISTYLPLRVNQAGVIPIIFALSLLLFPQMIANFAVTLSGNETIKAVALFVQNALANHLVYGLIYFFLVFVFTYFYTAVTFDPFSISTNLQKRGAFIPGIRPGQPTAEYIGKVLTRITFVGALFLGIIAVLPTIMQAVTGITSLAIGGTSLLIVVSVVTDLIKKIDAQLTMKEY